MFGVEVTFQDGKKVIGCLFADRTIYLHEPISDMWLSVADMLAELGDRAKGFRIVGPVVDVETARKNIEADYVRMQKELDSEKRKLDRRYQEAVKQLEEYEQADESVSFLNGEETGILGHIDTPGKWINGDIRLQDGTIVKPARSHDGSTQAYLSDKILSAEQRQELRERIELMAATSEAA